VLKNYKLEFLILFFIYVSIDVIGTKGRFLSSEDELIKIIPTNLETNKNATFCKRDPEVMDTIIFHHSETPTTTTVSEINDYHLNRGSSSDPWYMIGYHFAITAPYSTGRLKKAVYAGRPIDIAGAHVGGEVYSINGSEETKQLLQASPLLCGKENEEPKIASDTFNAKGEYKINHTSVAIVVIGNYAVKSRHNPGGYSSSRPRRPSSSVLDMSARLACELQKQYPRLKTLKWHNFYKATSCPGLIKNEISKIATLARKYGCTFDY
jgi:hypothetical protein